MTEKLLAIVIPAYKSIFLKDALTSISEQTNKNFTVYIGDDASPEDLYSIVARYEQKVDIKYKRFDSNIGGTDLVAHWERCIDLCTEQWIWLFSDDDIMGSECANGFYKAVTQFPGDDIFHFDVSIINQDGNITSTLLFPSRISVEEMFEGKVKRKLSSFVVEYIFKRSLYEEKGKFQKFDLAWGSDDATWFKFIGKNKLLTITQDRVYWRHSNSNISSNSGTSAFINRKIMANLEFLSWVRSFFKENNLKDNTTKLNKLRWMLESIKFTHIALFQKIKIAINAANGINAGAYNTLWAVVYLIYFSIKRSIKKNINFL